MKAVCPADSKHKRFVTVAHVTEDWIVDEKGDFVEVAPHSEMCVVTGPTIGNTWTCLDCCAEAKVIAGE